jgi:hypothetical protein
MCVRVGLQAKKQRLFMLLTEPRYYRPPLLVFVASRAGTELLAAAVGRAVLSVGRHDRRTLTHTAIRGSVLVRSRP